MLAPEWRGRAASLGLTQQRVRRITGGIDRKVEDADHEEIAEALLGDEGLTAHQASFDRRDVVRGFAAACLGGTTLQDIDRFMESFLASPDVVPLTEPGALLRREDVIRRRDGRLVSAVADSPLFSTRSLLAVEQRIVASAVAGVDAGRGVATATATTAARSCRPALGTDQSDMVSRLCRDGAALQIVVGPPGTGKTFALAAAREAWEQSGVRVLGAAVARRAAMELSASAGIDATSVAALLTDLRQAAGELLDPSTVLVVDEAAMLGTRQLDELLRYVEAAGSKLVLVGDHAQLPEIEAGGAFRALAARTKAIRLEINRRQKRESDQRLLEHWRSGELRQALIVAGDQGDLLVAASPEDAYRNIVSDYCAAAVAREDAVMLAPRRAEVTRLNRLARSTLVEMGHIGTSAIEVRGAAFAPGDRIVCRRNDRRLRVENGTRGEVIAVDPVAQSMTIALANGDRRLLPSRYIHLTRRSGGASIEHGYAMTAHLAQGMTTDRAFVLGSETVYPSGATWPGRAQGMGLGSMRSSRRRETSTIRRRDPCPIDSRSSFDALIAARHNRSRAKPCRTARPAPQSMR